MLMLRAIIRQSCTWMQIVPTRGNGIYIVLPYMNGHERTWQDSWGVGDFFRCLSESLPSTLAQQWQPTSRCVSVLVQKVDRGLDLGGEDELPSRVPSTDMVTVMPRRETD